MSTEGPGSQNWHRFHKLRPNRKNIQKRAQTIEKATLKHARSFLVERLDSIKAVRRHALGWLLAVSLLIVVAAFQLIGYQRSYSLTEPMTGGTFAEGVVGPLGPLNPIYATTPAERSASKLIFSGLMSYDATNHLRSDLADSLKLDDSAKRYTVSLKKNLKWQDGTPITADDIVFTVGLMKNPLVRSPHYASWQSIKVSKVSDTDVAFELARPYAAFLHALTFGIVPQHLLKDVKPELLRDSEFGRQPVGSGPFKFSRRQVINPDEDRSIVYLEANDLFVRGRPKLDRFQLHVFKDSAAIKNAFLSQEITAGSDLTSGELFEVKGRLPHAQVLSTTVSNGMYAMLRNDSPSLSDLKVRQALLRGTNRSELIKALHGYANPLELPLAPAAVTTQSRQAAYDMTAAAKLLDEAGWKLNGSTRAKDGVPMTINLVSVKSGDYPTIVANLKKQWEKLGITVKEQLVDSQNVQQTILLPRNYDVLIYELELGSDPDVFAYWHKSQADPRGLNLANYKSDIASDALESAQVRTDFNLRQQKYQTFIDTWLTDTPAIALYQPQIHYITTDAVTILQSSSAVVDRIDRYRQVELWTVERGQVYATP